MDPATAKTDWPAMPIPNPVKELLNRWFALTDDKSDNAALKMSREIFTPDGTWLHPRRTFIGQAEISQARAGAWNGIASRRHEVLKVYTCNAASDDILMTGNLIVKLENGKKIDQGFCARAVIDQLDTDVPKFKFFQGWTDTAPVKEALKST